MSLANQLAATSLLQNESTTLNVLFKFKKKKSLPRELSQ
jgi:hypothetical protein